jgi:hypothetical protein
LEREALFERDLPRLTPRDEEREDDRMGVLDSSSASRLIEFSAISVSFSSAIFSSSSVWARRRADS